MNIVVAGHVDHGKSTIVGRLLVETDSLPVDKIQNVRSSCERSGKPFEYAYLVDALRDEQTQGITIDSSRIFFKTPKRPYVIIDAPGHLEFLKNMISGASRADAALLVIDGQQGIRENSRRHGFMLSFLGIKQVAVLVNKIDLLNYGEEKFLEIENEYTAFLEKWGVTPSVFIPVSGLLGANLATRSKKTPWYKGPTLLEMLDQFTAPVSSDGLPFRMPVQDVYKFTGRGDTRRIVAGTIESGKLRVGDSVVFFPSMNTSKVKSLEEFNGSGLDTIGPGRAVGFTLEDDIYLNRGEVAAKLKESSPQVTTAFRASLIWLGQNPLKVGKEYLLKLGTSRTRCRIGRILRSMGSDGNGSLLEAKENQTNVLNKNEVADVVIELFKPIALDEYEKNVAMGRFVLVDEFEISGGGTVLEIFQDLASQKPSAKSSVKLSEKGRQTAALVMIRNEGPTRSNQLAKELEKILLSDGRIVCRFEEKDFKNLKNLMPALLGSGMILLIPTDEPSPAILEKVVEFKTEETSKVIDIIEVLRAREILF